MFNFKLAKRYDVTYLSSVKKFAEKKATISITLKDLMFYKSTPCYYIFWTGSEQIRLKKNSVQDIKEH